LTDGLEVTYDVLESPASIVFDQAGNPCTPSRHFSLQRSPRRMYRVNPSHVSNRRLTTTVVAVLVASSALTTGCSTHQVAAFRPCPQAAKAVAVSDRGAIGLVKIGLTPEGLKRQEKCR
jgi:hypothetical protein